MLRNNWAMTKTAQYRKLKSDWKNIVLLSKSRIQGLGLFATRDIDAVSLNKLFSSHIYLLSVGATTHICLFLLGLVNFLLTCFSVLKIISRTSESVNNNVSLKNCNLLS